MRLLAFLFILATAPVVVLFALAVPVGEVPDEAAHIERADSVRHGEIAGVRRALDPQAVSPVDVSVRIDMGALAAGFAFTPGTPLVDKHLTQARVDTLRSIAWTNRLDWVRLSNTGVYPPFLYIPAAAAMQLAKYLGHGPYVAVLAARLLNALLYIAAGAAAIALALRGRPILFALLCLPMSLSLAASINQDGLVIACAALAGALLTRPERRAWWCAALLLDLAAMAKPNLLPLALLVPVLTPGGWRNNRARAGLGFTLAAGPAAIWTAAMALFVATPFPRPPAQPGGPLWTGDLQRLFATTDPAAQLHILLEAPLRMITLPLAGLWEKGVWFWREAIGVIGTLDVVLPMPMYTAWTWALAAGLLAGLFESGRRPPDLRPTAAVIAVGGGVLAVWAICILQYLSWTRVGADVVEGLQGRYLIPIAALALPVASLPILRRPPGAPLLRLLLSMPAVLMGLAGLAILPLVLVGAYYFR